MNLFNKTGSLSNRLLLLCFLTCVSGKIFTRCELFDLLLLHDIPLYQIPTWICIANKSGLDSRAGSNPVLGIFKIHTQYWKFPCKMRNQDFIDDNISDDITCAKRIYREPAHGTGFSPFGSPSCETDSFQYIEGCFSQAEMERVKLLFSQTRPK